MKRRANAEGVICVLSTLVAMMYCASASSQVEAGTPAAASAVHVEFASISDFDFSGASQGVETLWSDSKETQLRIHSQFAKLILVFSKDVSLSKIEVETCSSEAMGKSKRVAEFKDGAEFFFFPGWRQSFVEGGKSVLAATVPDEMPVRTVSINFRYNEQFCLSGLRIFSPTGQQLNLVGVPEINANVKGDGQSYYLIDSRPDTAWRVAQHKAELEIEFEAPQTIEQLHVWNGDQSSSSAFGSIQQVEEIEVRGENNKTEVVGLKQESGRQDIKLKKPMTSRSFKLTARAKNMTSRFMAISELRFGTSQGQIRVSSKTSQKKFVDEILRQFGEAKLESALNRELVTGEKNPWIFRFRTDGSFFVRGLGNNMEEARAFYASGTFKVLDVDKRKINLELSGFRRASAFAWDGYTCGLGCDVVVTGLETSVSDLMTLERSKNRRFMLRNRSPLQERSLPFGDLRVKMSSLHD